METININTNLNNLAKELLTHIEAKRKASKNENLLKNSIITIYFDTLNTYLKDEQLTKNGLPLSQKAKISAFKSELLTSISDTDKLTNNIFSVFNQATMKKNGLKIEKLRLLSYADISKYSKLTNSYISKIDYKLSIKDIILAINNQYNEQMKNEKLSNATKLLEKNSYTIAIKA